MIEAFLIFSIVGNALTLALYLQERRMRQDTEFVADVAQDLLKQRDPVEHIITR